MDNWKNLFCSLLPLVLFPLNPLSKKRKVINSNMTIPLFWRYIFNDYILFEINSNLSYITCKRKDTCTISFLHWSTRWGRGEVLTLNQLGNFDYFIELDIVGIDWRNWLGQSWRSIRVQTGEGLALSKKYKEQWKASRAGLYFHSE